ncbi:hypothetical protein JCM10296v2_003709 [Rhodotorula toruloides]
MLRIRRPHTLDRASLPHHKSPQPTRSLFSRTPILSVEKAADVDFAIVTKPTDTGIVPRSLLSRLVDRLDKALDEREHERELMLDKGAMLRTTVLILAAERNITHRPRAPTDYESELDYLVAETSLTNVLLNPVQLKPIWQGFHQSRLNVARPELSEERFSKSETFSRENNIAGILQAAKIVSRCPQELEDEQALLAHPHVLVDSILHLVKQDLANICPSALKIKDFDHTASNVYTHYLASLTPKPSRMRRNPTKTAS